jgi:RHS repeat-associated protein
LFSHIERCTFDNSSGTRTLDYAADGQMIAETLAFNTSLFTVHEKFDTLGRNVGYALSNAVAQITGTMQSFDQYGRLNQVAVDGISGAFTYGYLEGTHLQKTLAMPNGVTRTFGYEPNRDLITMIVHSNATDRLVQRDFTFDGLGRLFNRPLLRANETPVQPDAFGYNVRSELTNAVIGANAFAYNFDPIGNRLEATEFGTNTSYITSALNQYTSISNSVPLCEMNPEFDLDGNQTLLKTTTGIWRITYNAENRPILFSNETTKVEMAYDYKGRRFEYKETVSGTLTRHERYLYRSYLQIATLDMLNSASIKHTITWDTTEPVATRPLLLQVGTNMYYYSFDQVKNVTELFDSAGTLAAAYDYSPFGQLTSALNCGSSALDVASNPLTFSSEVHDSTLGLQYYNYRHLNLLDGRWVNRDLFEEQGGINTFGFAENNAIHYSDKLGLFPWVEIGAAVVAALAAGIGWDQYSDEMIMGYYGGEEPFKKETRRQLAEKGPFTALMWDHAASKDYSHVRVFPESQQQFANVVDTIINSPEFKERSTFIKRRIQEGTEPRGHKLIEFNNDNDLAYSIHGAQLYYEFDVSKCTIKFWVSDVYNFDKSHMWKKLQDKKIISTFRIGIRLPDESVNPSS